MGSRRIERTMVLPTSAGLVLIRQKNPGEMDSLITTTPAKAQRLIRDIQEVCAEIKKCENKKKKYKRRNKGVIWPTTKKRS